MFVRLAAFALLAVLSCETLPEFSRTNPLDHSNPHFVPPAVNGLSVSRSGSSISMYWDHRSMWEDGFIIERAVDSLGAFAEIALLPKDVGSYIDPFTFAAFSAQYRVTPYMLKDETVIRGESRYASVELFTFARTPPSISLASETALVLHWTDPFTFETGYVIERRVGTGPFAPHDTVPASTVSFVDTSGPEGVMMNAYRIIPVRDSVRGPVSPIAAITTLVSPPEAVDLAVESSGTVLRLAWSMQVLASGYRVWRSSPQGTQLMATLPPDVRQWIDEHPDTNQGSHGYRVATLTSYASVERTAHYRPALVERRILSDAGSPLTCVAYAADGRIIAGGEDRRLTVWSADGGLQRRIDVPGIPEAIDVHPSQPWAAVATLASMWGSGGVEIYDINAGTRLSALAPPGYIGVFSPVGDRVAVTGDFSTVVIRNVTTPDTIAVLTVPHSGGIYSARFSPDGSKILVGARGGYAHLYDAASGAFIRTFTCPPADIMWLAFSPDGSVCFVPGGYLRGAFLYNVSSGAMLWHEWTGILRFGVFLSNSRLMTAGGSDLYATIWDVPAQQRVMTAPGHQGAIRGIALSAAGVPATASADGTVRVWMEGKQWFVD